MIAALAPSQALGRTRIWAPWCRRLKASALVLRSIIPSGSLSLSPYGDAFTPPLAKSGREQSPVGSDGAKPCMSARVTRTALTRLTLTDFRSYDRAELPLD